MKPLPEKAKVDKWRFEWLCRWDEVWDPAFVSMWKGLMRKSPNAHVFFEPSIVRAWVETYKSLQDIQPRFLVGRGVNELTLFMPLVYVKGSWKNAWQHAILPVGYSEFDYHDPIIKEHLEPEAADILWKELLDEICSEWGRSVDVFTVDGLHANITTDSFEVVQSECAPFISLNGMNSIEDFLGSISQKMRGDINRQKRRLESVGKVRLRTFMKDESEEALLVLPQILSDHSKKWPQSYKAPGFHENLVRHCLNAGVLHMSELIVAGNPISWHIGFLYESRYYWYMPIYRPEYQQYSPGKIHLCMCIEEALKKGVSVFDLLRGDENYKRQWTVKNDSLFELKWHSKRLLPSVKSFCVGSIKPLISNAIAALKYR